MKLERISHPNYINFKRIKFRQNIPKLTWQLDRGRRKSKTDPDVPCHGRLHINESCTLHKQRTGKGPREGHPRAPCSAGHWEKTEHREAQALSQSWASADCWVQEGVPGKESWRAVGGQWERKRSLGPAQSSAEEGLWEWQCKAEGNSWSVRAGDSLLGVFPWGCVMMRK